VTGLSRERRLDQLAAAARQTLGYLVIAEQSPGNLYATGQATAAVAIWCAVLGVEDADQAIAIARTVAGADA